jgi:putative effector of murein hydrolase
VGFVVISVSVLKQNWKWLVVSVVASVLVVLSMWWFDLTQIQQEKHLFVLVAVSVTLAVVVSVTQTCGLETLSAMGILVENHQSSQLVLVADQ